MTRRNFWKFLTRIHRYAGLVLGVQILIWFASGFFMSFFDIDNVRGTHIAQKRAFDLSMEGVVPLSDLPLSVSTLSLGPLKSAELISVVGTPVYKITADEVVYLNAITAAPHEPISEAAAAAAAARYYTGSGAVKRTTLLTQAPIEFRGALPVWQVSYQDPARSRLYIDAQTAELTAVRTRLWRIFDFMWMLHIMDYDGRDDINNWWLWAAALFSALFALSGLSLVVHRIFLRPHRSAGPLDERIP